jgi:hypothetical protein
MRQDDLDEYLRRRPFQPFRLHLSTGAFFDIHQPQLAYASRSTLALGLPLEGNQQRFVSIALVHIVWIESLVPAP